MSDSTRDVKGTKYVFFKNCPIGHSYERRKESYTVCVFRFIISRHFFEDKNFVYMQTCLFFFFFFLFSLLPLDRCCVIQLKMMSSDAFVTLATNDGYALGALVLAQSIRHVGTKRNLVVLISDHLSDLIRFTSGFSINGFGMMSYLEKVSNKLLIKFLMLINCRCYLILDWELHSRRSVVGC